MELGVFLLLFGVVVSGWLESAKKKTGGDDSKPHCLAEELEKERMKFKQIEKTHSYI